MVEKYYSIQYVCVQQEKDIIMEHVKMLKKNVLKVKWRLEIALAKMEVN